MTTLSQAFAQGTAAARPAASTSNAGYYYLATDTNGGTLYQSTGSAWVQLAPGVSSSGSGSLAAIQEQIVGAGGAASVSFSSIPTTYRHLLLEYAGRSDTAAAAGDLWGRFNGDTGSNYATVYLFNNEAASGGLGNGGFFGQTWGVLGALTGATAPAGAAAKGRVLIMDYARTAWQKDWRGEANRMDSSSRITNTVHTGHWSNTAAITTILLQPQAGNFVQDSVFTLYGLKNS